MKTPTTGFLRGWQIIGSVRRGIPPLIPVSRTTWLDGVKSGRFPRPVRIGPRLVAWRAEDIRALVESFVSDETAAARTSQVKRSESARSAHIDGGTSQ